MPRWTCFSCQSTFTVKPDILGQKHKCPTCGTVSLVTDSEPPKPPPPKPSPVPAAPTPDLVPSKPQRYEPEWTMGCMAKLIAIALFIAGIVTLAEPTVRDGSLMVCGIVVYCAAEIIEAIYRARPRE